MRSDLTRIAIILLLVSAGATRAQWTVTRLNSLELNRAGFDVSELSGITHRHGAASGQGNFVALADDNGYVYSLDVDVNAASLNSAVVRSELILQDDTLDTEGIVFHPSSPDSLYIAFERDKNEDPVIPGIRQYHITTGQRIQSIPMPTVWNTDGNTRSNRGFESLTIAPHGKVMWTANEEALTIDGERATQVAGTIVRLQKIMVAGSTAIATSQFAYEVSPIHGTNPDKSGLVELLALPDGNLLTLERSESSAPIIESRLYQVSFTDATDLSDASFDAGLLQNLVEYTPVTKTLLWSGVVDGNQGLKMEGLALGEQLPDGSWPLVGVVDNGGGNSGNVVVGFNLQAPTAYGDFDLDADFDCDDVNALVLRIVAGNNEPAFDLTRDGFVDAQDQTEWLANAALADGLNTAYRPGDANLDGFVDASDFNIWNDNKFSSVPAWCSGDFNHDGVVDTSDFNVWNDNKFTSSDAVLAVPEPPALWTLLIACGWLFSTTRRVFCPDDCATASRIELPALSR